MIRILIATLLAVVLQVSASAEDLRSATVQKLYEFTQDSPSDTLAPVRGGTKDKALGCYLGSKSDIQYRSGYKDVEPRTQCEWAYDLNQFIVTSGGGWDNLQKYKKETPVSSDANSILNDSLRSYGGGNLKDPWERAHVPYDKQAAFADKWWKNNSRAYSSAVVPPKDWWLHDAVLDGNNLWTRYEQINGKGSADYVMWRDAELARLLKKQ